MELQRSFILKGQELESHLSYIGGVSPIYMYMNTIQDAYLALVRRVN